MTTVPHDDLSLDDYRLMYLRLRCDERDGSPREKSLTLRGVVSALKPHGATWSIGAWSKYDRELLRLNVEARNALRRYFGLDDVPRAPAEIVADANIREVVEVSKEPDTIVLIGPETEAITIKPNNNGGRDPSKKVLVTEVTRPRMRRRPRKSITVHEETHEALSGQLERLRLASDEEITWDKFERFLVGLARHHLDESLPNCLDKQAAPVVE